MTNEFSVRYTLSLDDYREFSKAFRSLTLTRSIGCHADVIAMVVLLGLSVLSWFKNDVSIAYYLFALVICLAVFRCVIMPWQERRQFAHQELGLYEITLHANDDGFLVRSELSEGLQKWASIRRVDDLPDLVLLWPNNCIGWMIPKRAFSTPAEAEAFVEFAKEKTAGQEL